MKMYQTGSYVVVNVAQDFSAHPGGRFKSGGDHSGQEFRDKVLKPAYFAARETGRTLRVELDGTYGYHWHFLEEAFGGLMRQLQDPGLKNIEFDSYDSSLISEIQEYIDESFYG